MVNLSDFIGGKVYLCSYIELGIDIFKRWRCSVRVHTELAVVWDGFWAVLGLIAFYQEKHYDREQASVRLNVQ